MSLNIIHGKNFDSQNINYSELKKLDNGAKKNAIKYKNKPFFIQTRFYILLLEPLFMILKLLINILLNYL